MWMPGLEALSLACLICGERPSIKHRSAHWEIGCACGDTIRTRYHWRAVMYWAMRASTEKPAWNNTPFRALTGTGIKQALLRLEKLRDYLELAHYRNVMRREAGRPTPVTRYERDLQVLEAARLAIAVCQMDLPHLLPERPAMAAARGQVSVSYVCSPV